MEEKPIQTFTVGKSFPGPVPHREGAIMELWEMGLVVVIQYPELRSNELNAFHEGFKQYSYLESPTEIPIAVWVFDFPESHGEIDTSFNARVVDKELIDDFLNANKGGIKNALQFFLLDGKIIKGMKMISLHPEAVELFHRTIRKQLSMDYDMSDFTSSLAEFFTHTTRELFEMGRKFQHK